MKVLNKKRQFCFQDDVFMNKVETTSHRFEHKVNLLVKMIFLLSVAGPCVWSMTSRLVQWDTVWESDKGRGEFFQMKGKIQIQDHSFQSWWTYSKRDHKQMNATQMNRWSRFQPDHMKGAISKSKA